MVVAMPIHEGQWVSTSEAGKRYGVPGPRVTYWAEQGLIDARKNERGHWRVRLPLPAELLERHARNSKVVHQGQNHGGLSLMAEKENEIYIAVIRLGPMTAKLTHFEIERGMSITLERLMGGPRSAGAFDEATDGRDTDPDAGPEPHNG